MLPTPTPDPVALPPMPNLRILFVYLHAQAGGDFFSDTAFAWTAGELRQLGFSADVLQVYFPRSDFARAIALEGEFIEIASHYQVIVLDQVWQPQLIAQLQAGGARVVATDPFAQYAGQRVEFALAHFLNHRQPLLDLVLALRDGTDLRQVPNLQMDLLGFGPIASAHVEPYPATPQSLRPFCPIVGVQVLGELRDLDGKIPPIRKTLDTNTGCPFSDPVQRNVEFADVDLSDSDITLKGCAFCFMGGDYRALPVPQTVQVHIEQIAYYQAHLPHLAEVILRDQSALRYLPQLLQTAIDKGLKPLGFLLPGRGDAILRFGPQLRQAAEIAHKSGFWFTIHLIGFESFSQPQLDLYNKGVTVAEYAEALKQMRELHRQYPDSFALHKYGASSFILFNPWTTLQDLRDNVDFCRDHALLDMAHGLTLTRLRLYPNLPLYWKAKKDGLLQEKLAVEMPTDQPVRGAAFTGYSAEAHWRYRDVRVALVEDLQQTLQPHVQLSATVGLLDAALRYVAGHYPQTLKESPQDWTQILGGIEQAFKELRALWRPAQSEKVTQSPPAQQRTVLLGRHCNNHCRNCVAQYAEFAENREQLQADIAAAARAQNRVTLAGREPTLLRDLPLLVKSANGARVELVSNGRVLAQPRVARQLARAGVALFALKRHRLADTDEDTYVQAEGAGAQVWQAAAHIQALGTPRWLLQLIVVRDGLGDLQAIARRAHALGARGVQVRVMAAELDLARLRDWRAALVDLRGFVAEIGLDWGLEGF